jgi:hypothetical protein
MAIKDVCLNASAHGIDGPMTVLGYCICMVIAQNTCGSRATAANDARPPRSFEANVARRVIIPAWTNTVSFPMRPNASVCFNTPRYEVALCCSVCLGETISVLFFMAARDSRPGRYRNKCVSSSFSVLSHLVY